MTLSKNYRHPTNISLLLTISGTVMAQGRLVDYQRSEALKTKLKDKVYNAPQQVNWTKNGTRCWYTIQTRGVKSLWWSTQNRKPGNWPSIMNNWRRNYRRPPGKKIKPYNLPFTTLTFGKDDKAVEFVAEGFTWQYGPGKDSSSTVASAKKGRSGPSPPTAVIGVPATVN